MPPSLSTPKNTLNQLGVLLTNTGSPDAPTPAAVKRYLAQFLADPRVIEYPRWLWLPLLHGLILQVRPRRSAALYKRVWTEDGSPLILASQQISADLQKTLSEKLSFPVATAVGMCYGNPAIDDGLTALRDAGVQRIIVLPLFPQYSGTTTGASIDAVMNVLKRWRWLPDLQVITDYHDHPAYIGAVSKRISERWDGVSKLLLSFHGIPKSYVDKGDPYQAQCHRSASLIAETLQLAPEAWSVSFQSRFGPAEWLTPYTDKEFERFGSAGLDGLTVVCPGFAADCLETLDEINHEGRTQFQEAGGLGFEFIPCMNATPDHVSALAEIIHSKIQISNLELKIHD
jgi:ferrochelatase